MKLIQDHWDCSSIAAEVRLQYINETKPEERKVLDSPEKAAEILWEIFPPDQIEFKEHFCVLLLNNSKQLLGYGITSVGGKTATIVDVSEIITIALLGAANSIIISHNHPSGKLVPSASDMNLTNRVRRALSYVGISMDDHLIVTKHSYYSFSANREL
jgi:DNA repair protein RadC